MKELVQTLNGIPWYWLFLVGFIAGLVVGSITNRVYRVGIIHVKPGIDKKPDTYLFEFNVAPEVIPTKKNVQFEILIEPADQQKLQSV